MKPQMRTLNVILATVVVLAACQVTARAQAASRQAVDEATKTLIEHRLLMHGLLRNDNIIVSVKDGNVTLAGHVNSLAEKRQAELDAYNLGEFHHVQNSLVVDEGKRSDAEIAEEVTSTIRRHVFYTIFDWIEAQCQNRVVTLTGSVDAAWKKQEYAKQAEKAAGVRTVKNEIEVQPNTSFENHLRVYAATSIYDDPLFARYAAELDPPIHVIVSNGVVMLKGVVASLTEKAAADEILLSGTQVFELANDLMIVQQNKKGS